MKEDGTIPAWGGNYSPFRLVARDSDEWSVTLEEVNAMSYDSTKLFRSSLNIDIGIAPLSLIVLFDGTLVLPMCAEIPKSRALVLFNQHLTDLLLSGLFSGEILPDDVTPGAMNLWGYHRHSVPTGRYSKFSQALRTRKASPDDAIVLVDIDPLTEEGYTRHHLEGAAISRVLPDYLATVFLPSCTAFCNEEWERALILGWSCAELLISQLWGSAEGVRPLLLRYPLERGAARKGHRSRRTGRSGQARRGRERLLMPPPLRTASAAQGLTGFACIRRIRE